MSWRARLATGLLVIACLLWALVVYMDYQARASPLDLLQGPSVLTFEGALVVCERMDQLADQLPMPPMERNNRELYQLAVEILPYYFYEGISNKSVMPTMAFVTFTRDSHFHTLGAFFPYSDEIKLNNRFQSEWSSRWYSSPLLLSVLIHELAHAQGIVGLADDVEPATQLATLEVLASMVRDGNIYALPAFVRDLVRYAGDYAWSRALSTDRLPEYEAHVRRVANTEQDVATYYRSKDHWAPMMGRLREILTRYGEMPYILLVEALADPEHKTRELPSLPNIDHRLCMNDTAWVLEHLEALTQDYNAHLQAYHQATGEGKP